MAGEWILELDRGEGFLGRKLLFVKQSKDQTHGTGREVCIEDARRESEWFVWRKTTEGQKVRLVELIRTNAQRGTKQREEVRVFIPNGPASGNKVIEAQREEGVWRQVLFNDLNFMLPPMLSLVSSVLMVQERPLSSTSSVGLE